MFADADRDIFRYNDGSSDKFGDPLRIEERLHRALEDHDLDALEKHLESENPTILYDALAKLLPAARAAFRLAAFDEDTGEGLPDDSCLEILSRFFEWREKKEASGARSPSTSAPSATPRASRTPTNPGADSTGTASGSSPSPASPPGGG